MKKITLLIAALSTLSVANVDLFVKTDSGTKSEASELNNSLNIDQSGILTKLVNDNGTWKIKVTGLKNKKQVDALTTKKSIKNYYWVASK